MFYLLQAGNAIAGNHTLLVAPRSVHVSVVAAAGMRPVLHWYSIIAPVRNWTLISVGVVIA